MHLTVKTEKGFLKLSPSEPIRIGSKGDLAKRAFFTGAIDDVRFYNRALNEDEALALFLATPEK